MKIEEKYSFDNREEEFQSREMIFRNIYGRESKVKIIGVQKIGYGGFGDIFEVKCKIFSKNNPDKYKIRTWVLKKFKYTSSFSKDCFLTWKMLKKNGYKVFNTYRISKDKQSILMTNANNHSFFTVSVNNYSLAHQYLRKNKATVPVEQFANIARSVFKQAVLARKDKIVIPQDAYMFSINSSIVKDDYPGLIKQKVAKNCSKLLDFVIGDLDLVKKQESSDDFNLLRYNISNAFEVLDRFVDYYLEGINQDECFSQVDLEYKFIQHKYKYDYKND